MLELKLIKTLKNLQFLICIIVQTPVGINGIDKYGKFPLNFWGQVIDASFFQKCLGPAAIIAINVERHMINVPAPIV